MDDKRHTRRKKVRQGYRRCVRAGIVLSAVLALSLVALYLRTAAQAHMAPEHAVQDVVPGWAQLGEPLICKNPGPQWLSGQGEALTAGRSAADSAAFAQLVEMAQAEGMAACYFFSSGITEDIRARITGISYPDPDGQAQISYEDLAYVHVLHYDFDDHIKHGELICNRSIAQDLLEIFKELFEAHYQIEKICLIDAYGGDDEASMRDDNTSCFNYRTVPGKTKLSRHAYGLAVDINPLYNPYVRTKDGGLLISPDNAGAYVDRSADFPHKIDEQDLCYEVFVRHGFTWGGGWNSVKDYQHFEKR